VLGGRDHVGPHAGRRVERDDLRTFLAQPARDMAAAGRDVEDLHARVRVAELHDGVEVLARRMRRARAVRVRALVPDVAHAFASSTARFAASSIVGST
jgi:hypothetical protein